MPSKSQNRELAKAFLEASETEWEELVRKKIARELVTLIPFVVEYQDNLEDAKKFFNEMKELEVVPLIDKQLDALDKVRVGITSVANDETLDPKEAKLLLKKTYETLARAFTDYAKTESEIIEVVREKSIQKPKQARITEKARPYWNYLDKFWPNEREALLGKLRDYFDRTNSLLREAASSLKIPFEASTSNTLVQVESLLRKRNEHFAAQRVGNARENIRNYYIEELGLIPGYVGAKGNWKVEKDDCPEKKLPEFHTRLTDRFAFCRLEDKECPSFDWSQGSYVRCKSFVTIKEAELISGIQVLDDEGFLKKLQRLAETDPFLQMLFHKARQGNGDLFIGRTIDNRLETMLEQFPTSNRRGNDASYRVYLVANEPVLVSGGHAVAADKILLETIGEGVRMPRTATTLRVAGPMIRLTFTANALRDPEFRDFLRKKKAVQARHWTWDIPFEKEDDIAFVLSEIKEEFGYPIAIMQILDDAENAMYQNYNIRNFKDLPIVRHSSALQYIPRFDPGQVSLKTCDLSVSEKLIDVANQLQDGALKHKVANLADSLRVGAHYLVATFDDLVVYADNAIGIVPEPGMQFRVKDPDTGSMVMTEVTEVVRDKPGKPKKGMRYKVRTLDTGKEIEVKRPWTRPFDKDAATHLATCGCGDMQPPHDMEGKPPVGYFPADDGSFFIFRLPEQDRMEPPAPPPPAPMPPALSEPMGPPSPYGRFPGDAPPPMPPFRVPPRVEPYNPEAVPPFPPMGGPYNDVPAPPPPHGPPPPVVMGPPPQKEEHGPVKEDTQVFVPVDQTHNPDVAHEGVPHDEVESKILDTIKKRVKPGLKFTNLPRDPIAPSGALEEDIDEALEKLRTRFKDNPDVKDVRRDLSPHGKPVLFVHTTKPKALKDDEVPSSVNGFEVKVSPLHDSLADEAAEDKEAADVLVAPSPDRPENGHPSGAGEHREPGPYGNQVSGPPPMNDPLVDQTRDIPKY